MKDQATVIAEYREERKETPAERWRKPAIPVAVEHDTSRSSWDPLRNAWRPMVTYTFDAETVERFRLGRLCLECHEPQESPFPSAGEGHHLPHCSFDMRREQSDRFEKEFEGEKWLGPTTSLDYEFDRLEEEGQRKRFTAGSQIMVPRESGLLVPKDARG